MHTNTTGIDTYVTSASYSVRNQKLSSSKNDFFCIWQCFVDACRAELLTKLVFFWGGFRSLDQFQRWLDGDPVSHLTTPLFIPSSTLLSAPTTLRHAPAPKTPPTQVRPRFTQPWSCFPLKQCHVQARAPFDFNYTDNGQNCWYPSISGPVCKVWLDLWFWYW